MKSFVILAAKKVPTWVLYLCGTFYPSWLLWQGVSGGLGVDPVKAMEHALGEAGLQLLIAGLCITPLRRYAGLNLVKFRRALGLLAFTYLGLHLLVWLVLDVQIASQIWTDILKRPYITIGMAGFLLLIPLAATSNNYSIRRLGRRWHRLHKLTYIAVALGALHFVMLVKGFQLEPLLYMAAVIVLLLLRLRPRAARKPA